MFYDLTSVINPVYELEVTDGAHSQSAAASAVGPASCSADVTRRLDVDQLQSKL